MSVNEVLTLPLHMRNKNVVGFVSPYSLTIRFYFVSFLFTNINIAPPLVAHAIIIHKVMKCNYFPICIAQCYLSYSVTLSLEEIIPIAAATQLNWDDRCGDNV